jgi:nucleoside-diphosphate-sugar epimerase
VAGRFTVVSMLIPLACRVISRILSLKRNIVFANAGATDVGFLPLLIGLAKQKGVIGYPGDGANLWTAVHARDLASLFRLALEKGPAGKNWHGNEGEGLPFREIAEAIDSRLGLPAVSIPADVLMLPGYFVFLANLVTSDLPAFNLITRQTLGWEPAQPSQLTDLDNGHYFPAGSMSEGARSMQLWIAASVFLNGGGY